ncbi:MAG: ShlB/FhaC/HecB family hemolysin secretion/activation protein [Phenylobacterium sp.]|uniref:ShlB/FhaC/HecB family hemolysin secretion/activation protein n=1 Tax=Phenylobacterium sp. TaxID=1871053 RepID=UPI001A538565|nr:ShlB/FhaC/HecB family hemolysin secretion/activation protein [Phenylobacterium sp.]MBL8770099.1 ShlB/FhaC/HecB family hemolysin secretion/activation protein [Phenylobacterium sp.]
MAAKLLIALALICAPGLALAQTAPSRVVPPNRPDQTAPPRAPRGGTPPAPPAAAATPQVQPFLLRSVAVAGSSLPPAQLEAGYRPFIGRTVGVAELQQIADAVAGVYGGSDIALYTILVPDQTFEGGRLELTAVEGYVEAVTIHGEPGRARGLAQSYLRRLEGQRPLKRSTLQRSISLVRDIPGLTSDVQLQNGGQPGAVRVAATLDHRPVQFGLAVNNRGTAFLGRTQVQADVYFNSLLRPGDQTRLTYATPTRPRRFQFYALGHSQPLNADGATLQVNAIALRTRPKDTALLGHAYSAGVQVTHPIIRSFDRDLSVGLGLDGVDSDNAFFGFTFSDDRTRALRLSLAYSRSTDRSLFGASGAVSRGIAGLGARATVPEASRLDFTKANGRLTFNRTLAQPITLRLTGAGQYTGDRLPASEQFALGGEEFGRAFEASFIAGDYGYGAVAELAWRPPAPVSLAGSEAYVYVDSGKVWYRGRFDLPTQSARLSSAGGGVRVVVASRAIVQLEATKALTNPIPALDRSDWRGVFNIRTLF